MILHRNVVAVVLGTLMCTAAIGCGSTPPPKELMDARAAYSKAEKGPASQLAPAEVHEAKVALDRAEQAFGNEPKGEETIDFAYIAQRKAELAEAKAGIKAATRDKENAQKDMQTTMAGVTQKTQSELSQTREQLAATGQQLAAERQARIEAEKRARDAMDKLAVAAALAVKEEPRGTVITLPGNVLFATGKTELLPAAQEKLNQVAVALKNQEDHKMVVEGHTDSQGNETSNLDLSQRRAQTVRDFLVSRGVSSDKISAAGVGQARPVGDNKTAEGRAQNRRVEIIVQPVEKR